MPESMALAEVLEWADAAERGQIAVASVMVETMQDVLYEPGKIDPDPTAVAFGALRAVGVFFQTIWTPPDAAERQDALILAFLRGALQGKPPINEDGTPFTDH